MSIHKASSELHWEQISHHVLNRVNLEVLSLHQAEIFDYKNEDVVIRSIIRIHEHRDIKSPFSVSLLSYTHMQPHVIRLEFQEEKQLGEFESLAEAKESAELYFFKHHYRHNH